MSGNVQSGNQTCSASTDTVEYSVLSEAEKEKILTLQQAILELVTQGIDHKEIINTLCQLEEQLLPNSVASVMLLDENQHLNVYAAPSIPVAAISRLKGLRPGPGAGSCGNVIYRQEPVFVSDTLSDARWLDLRPLAIDYSLMACWSMPVYATGRKIIGSFALSSFEKRAPSVFHCKLLEIGASIIGIVLERNRQTEFLRLAAKVFESSGECIIITDNHQAILSVNRTYSEVTGYTSDEVTGQRPGMLNSKLHNAAFFHNISLSLTENGYWQGEIWDQRKNGEIYPVWLGLSVVRDSANTVTNYIGIFTDITTRKLADEALKTAAHQQLAILNNIPDMAWLKNAEGRYISVNEPFGALCGLTPDELVGKTDLDLWPESFAKTYIQDDLKVVQTAKGIKVEERLQNKQGLISWVETIKSPIFNEIGKVIGTTGIARDITERKQNEDQLRLLAKVFESSTEAIIIADAQRKIITVNAAFTLQTGYTLTEVAGTELILSSEVQSSPEFFQTIWKTTDVADHWQGEVWDHRKDGSLYPKWINIDVLRNNHEQITHYVTTFSDISERKEAEERIRFLAQHDILTGLPNRALFTSELTQAIANAKRQHHQLALFFIDLDHFKNINDSLGHHFGDLLLQEIAERLKSRLKDMDAICRQGGDEFILLLQDITSPDDVAHIAERLIEVLSTPVLLDSHEIAISASIGIALYPEDGDNGETLVKNADAAMYHAKQSGRDQYRFFVKALNDTVHERLTIESGLRKALERKEFELYYQPQINLISGEMIGVEALIRWHHPEFGMVPPVRFIPIAEDSGLIIPIGDWVLNEACRQAVAWQQAGLTELTMAVNLSAVQFRRGDVEKSINNALQASGLNPALLELELTESILIQDTEKMLATVQRLKSLGVKLSIDDFGTGYSSLSYLKRFNVDKLKIDQSFIRNMVNDPSDAAIVHAIIQMARSLNLKTIAEGVEEQNMLEALQLHQCHEAQGYYFARPMPADELARYAATR
ncbi:bifunctional diguanylate cyclase/phosphodiesterase [Sulfuriferula thiophila]|uniref:bifunctional diguanylate cyclase/phosphodiesterase n=1 Tax=Sulfuriferula thiophila TaxID=1781211 RepID=UPI000F61317A|nr:EAL domain-containing protein [Sulfuriferula thiophila]